jgi:hypothetical protein
MQSLDAISTPQSVLFGLSNKRANTQTYENKRLKGFFKRS